MAAPVFACVAPHPPIIVPAVGRGRERVTQATLEAYARLRERLAAAAPDVLLLICPHGVVTRDRFHLLTGRLQGDLGRFGAGEVRFDIASDGALVEAILQEAERLRVPLAPVERWAPDDHSAWVPLAHLREAAPQAEVIALAISFEPPQAHYALGRAVALALAGSEKRVAIIASADGAHALSEEGPYGFHADAPRFEEEFHEAFEAWDVERVLGFDEEFRQQAGEDSIPSVAFLMGVLAGRAVRPRILASEAPWGVGYMTALVEIDGDGATPEAPPIVRLAREAVETYVREGRWLRDLPWADSHLRTTRGGTFVAIHDQAGQLRGCVGTVTPVHPSLLMEVVDNAIAAASRDPRFPPVTAAELAGLAYKVDVLTPPEPAPDAAALDAKRYGVIVEAGDRRGLLLPDLEGVETVEQQIAICREKAGIGPEEEVRLSRFRVERFEEPATD